MRDVRLSLVAAVSVVAIGFSARAEQSLPSRWVGRFTAEDAPKVELPTYLKPLEIAEKQAFAGQYRRALYTLYPIKDADPIRFARVKAQCVAGLGRYDEAVALLRDAKVSDDPAVQTQLARLLIDRNDLAAARELLTTHLAKHPDSIVGRYLIGRVQELVGDTAKAIEAYDWFVSEPNDFVARWSNNADTFESAEELTTIARAIDRWAYLTSSYKDRPQLHDMVLAMFVRAYDVVDRKYWPARVAAAEFYATHDNNKEAVQELTTALRSNERDTELYDLLGQIMLAGYNFAGAEKAAEAIRATQPDSPVADLLDARNLLLQRRPDLAQQPIDRVLSVQPKNVEALSLKAAVAALQLREADMKALIAEVEALDTDNAQVYFEVAEQLGAVRQYPRAAEMYRVAIERAPYYTAARNGLGLLYTQWGDEDAARVVLTAARELDPFNVAATNYMKLLDRMGTMDVVETEHFIVMSDAARDPMVAAYFAPWLEKIHAGVCAEYRTEPPVKTKIQVFPSHAEFSVRTTGSPWIGTVGASTGSVIAMVTPRGGGDTMGPYNWAQVLRHEYTHTVTLAATENRIPHWMTEGLAVIQERAPMRWSWVPMLYQAVTKEELFTMEELTWGFVRPKRPQDRSLAYAQSAWVCQYLEETYGHNVMLKQLDMYKAGKPQDEVFPATTGKSITEFQADFFAWCDKQVASWGYDEETTQKYEARVKDGETLIKDKKLKEALPVWLELAELRPMDPLPKQRLAGLYLSKAINEPEKGFEFLERLHRSADRDPRYARRLAKLYRDAGKLDKAIEWSTEAIYVEPYNLEPHKMLIELYERTGDAAALEREKRLTAALEKWIAEEKQRNDIGDTKE